MIEVLSPHPRIGREDERVAWFARAGVRECWLVSTIQKAVAVLSLTANGVRSRTLHTGAEAIHTEVLEGLSLTPLQIFGW
jgi:Uma2 family endonuclease